MPCQSEMLRNYYVRNLHYIWYEFDVMNGSWQLLLFTHDNLSIVRTGDIQVTNLYYY